MRDEPEPTPEMTNDRMALMVGNCLTVAMIYLDLETEGWVVGGGMASKRDGAGSDKVLLWAATWKLNHDPIWSPNGDPMQIHQGGVRLIEGE